MSQIKNYGSQRNAPGESSHTTLDIKVQPTDENKSSKANTMGIQQEGNGVMKILSEMTWKIKKIELVNWMRNL